MHKNIKIKKNELCVGVMKPQATNLTQQPKMEIKSVYVRKQTKCAIDCLLLKDNECN